MEDNKRSSNLEHHMDISKEVTIRHSVNQVCNFMDFVSKIEPKNVNESLIDKHRSLSMQEEFNKFERNRVWEFVPKPSPKLVIKTK